MQAFYDWFRWLYDATGVNLSYVYDDFDRARMLRGLATTAYLAGITIVFSLVIGVFGAWLQRSNLAWMRRIVAGFISLFRNTPPLVQIYFFYFGLGPLLPRIPDPASGGMVPIVSSLNWAIISLSLFAGAFNIEIFRSGIEAVPRATIEAADALGYTRWQVYRNIVLPLALRTCLASLGNNLVNLVKTTNLAYAIAVPELMYVSKQIWADSANVPEMMISVWLAYVGLVSLLVYGLKRLEHWLRLPGFGQHREGGL
jgi:polar amino acid transport system permease protein